MLRKTTAAMLLGGLLLVGCAPGVAVDKPKPATAASRPTLMYQPGLQMSAQPKYPLKLGVMDVLDKRIVPFWYDADDFFSEPVSQGLSVNIYRDIRSSGIFSDVVRIEDTPPQMFSAKSMLDLKRQYGVDMILVTHLNAFHMSRDKTGDIRQNTYVVKPHIGLVSQLIFLDNGIVVWADKVDRTQEKLTGQGVLSDGQMGQIARQIVQDAVGDMKLLILQTGKVMRRAN